GAQPANKATVAPRAQAAADLGPASRELVFDFVVGLKLRHPHLLSQMTAERATKGPYLPHEFGDAFGPTPADYQRVASWLSEQGPPPLPPPPSRTTITARGTVAQTEPAFNIGMHYYQNARGTFVAATSAPEFPTAIGSLVSGTVGLSGEEPWQL